MSYTLNAMLLDNLNHAVCLLHPQAAKNITQHMLEDMSGEDFLKLPDFYERTSFKGAQDLGKQCEALRPKIEQAKIRYAHYLKVRGLTDIKITWKCESSLDPLVQELTRQEWAVIRNAWDRRYTDEPWDPRTKETGFSIVLTKNELDKLMKDTPNWKVQYSDNITPEFIELPYTSTAAKEEAVCPAGNDSQGDQQPQTHHSTTLDSQHQLQARLDKLERPLLERKYEPWYPFPSCAVTSLRRLYREQEFPSRAADHMGRIQALSKFDEYKSQKLEESIRARKPHQPRDVPQVVLKSISNAHAQADLDQLAERTGVSVQQKLDDHHQAGENTGDAAVKSSRNLNRGLLNKLWREYSGLHLLWQDMTSWYLAVSGLQRRKDGNAWPRQLCPLWIPSFWASSDDYHD